MSYANGPRIITDGLIIALDAENPKSYGGSGTTWRDMSGSGKNGTVNGAIFTSSLLNGKTFTFDGVNDTVSFGTGEAVLPLNNMTLELVFRSFGTVPTTGTSPALFGFTYGMNSHVGTTNLSFNAHDGVNPNITTNTNDNVNYMDGRWYHAAYTIYPTGIDIYVNGVRKNSGVGTWNGTTIWATNTFNIGRGNNNSNYFFYGDIPTFKFYNRRLSGTEIRQNYDAIKGRFGLS